MNRIIPGMLAWLLPITLMAAGEVRFQRISMADGLAQSSISSIAQCEDGYLWFGTQYGLNRYDGYTFKSYRHDPNDPASLSDSAITGLKWSESGYLWVATRNGLNRFDTRRGTASRHYFPEAYLPEHGRSLARLVGKADDGTLYLLSSQSVGLLGPETDQIEVATFKGEALPGAIHRSASVVDLHGRLWVLNASGLWRLDQRSREMIRIQEVDLVARGDRTITLLDRTGDGRIVLVTASGLKLLAPESPDQYTLIRPSEHGHPDDGIEGMVVADDDSIWMVLDTSLVRYQPDQDDWQVLFDAGERQTGLRRQLDLQIISDQQGDYWLAGPYGLARWPSEGEQLQVFFHDPGDDGSIPPTLQTHGYELFLDDNGTVWLGSQLGGLAYFSPRMRRFQHVVDRSAPGEIPYAGHNIVRGIAEHHLDGSEYLWLALDAAGLRQLRRRPDGGYDWVRSFHANAPEPQRLPGDRIWDVSVDPVSGLVWALDDHHLISIDPDQSQVLSILPVFDRSQGGRATTLRFAEDGSALWVGSSRGIKKFHMREDRTRPQPCSSGRQLTGRTVFNLVQGDDDLLLAATRDGLGLVSFHGGQATGSRANTTRVGGLSTEFYGLARHAHDGFWVGSRDRGLAHLHWNDSSGEQPVLDWYGLEDGLVNETIYAILPQQDGQLWLSSNQGLMLYDPDTSQVRHFTPPDGIQHLEFNNGVAHVGPSGRFYFGGINGINAFRPENVLIQTGPPRVLMQEVRVNGVAVERDLDEPAELELQFHQNDLELMFVGLHFSDPIRNRYSYQLKGLDQDWGLPGLQRQVRYAGLSPGSYEFWARAANSDGVWSDDHLLLTAVIRPPVWQTTWAYLAYVLAGLLLLVLAYGFHRQRRRALEAEVSARTLELQEQQALVRRQAAELRDALEARSRFFANISHEFRTPLTLIQSSLDRLEAGGGEPAAIERGNRYSQLLANLVDQLLDLSRLRAVHTSESEQPWSLASVVAFTVDAFEHTAEQRGLHLRSELEDGWWTHCSQEHVEKILLNLLANAIKFTSAGDDILVRLTAGGGGALLEVIDSGPGIPESEQGHVFQQFHRSTTAISEGIDGAGLGLALVREMALAMGGDVALDSKPGRGSCFSVLLPAFRDPSLEENGARMSADSDIRDTATEEPERQVTGATTQAQSTSVENHTVLVVEDNSDLRDHLDQILKGQWQVLLAADGREGLELAARHHPDVVISDIMMPRLDGFGLLEALRTNPETSHIPVLLLTARQDSEARLKGLTLSADDFMVKPFNAEELRVRLRRMLDNRERLRRYLLSESALENAINGDESPDLMRRDQELIEAVNQRLAENLSNPEFDVQALCKSVVVERRTLQRKLKALTGMTPATYIRHSRLRHARSLLIETDRSINEIALECGFSSSQHFSRLFRKHYHSPPDQWRRKNLV